MENRKLVVYIAQSLDGYIATKDDSLEWLFQVEGEGDNGYSKFYDTVDTILIGKRTYDWIMEQEKGEFPYKGKECYVFSRTPKAATDHVQFVQGDIVSFMQDLKSKQGKNIWMVGGGNILHPFLAQGLVDELIVTIAPAVIGDGIPLFKAGDYKLNLHLKSANTFNQFVELQYEVLHE
ncbi:dihydrofolate reductase family protein (plasmid) [Niallia taxi]|uniref:dihydrofolate reductase family protein n=1 Tax=Niallia taxi TaxID=2499688 RepID=UPI002E1D688E|nr:dihydrofolate reductase family protein [Niallia taxi]MED4120883.1 dihydrofolate reductase family protein [Niallia taxi]